VARSMDPYFKTSLNDGEMIQHDFTMTLGEERMEYQRLKGYTPNKGQRKLFLAKFLFLLDVKEHLPEGEKIHIVYVGAAPGCSIHVLDEILDGPEWIARWDLYDMVPMDSRLRQNPDRFGCYQQYFTNVDAKEFESENKLVFLTDIRLSPNLPRHDPQFTVESDILIWKDLHCDQEWMQIMQPWMWWRKFRMPYAEVDGNTSMQCIPSEKIYYQAWIGAGSTETRATGTLDNIKEFQENPEDPKFTVDFKTYEEQLQYYNAKQRPMHYAHNLEYRGICHCTDCNIEIFTICRFLREIKKVTPTTKLVGDFITFLDSKMPSDSKLVDLKSPHGKYPLLSIEERDRILAPELKKYQKTKERKNRQRMGGTSRKF